MRSTQFENDAIIEPSCSLNGLIRLSSVHCQSSDVDDIIRHHEMLKPATPRRVHSAAAAAAAAPETHPAPTVPYISLPRLYVSWFSPTPSRPSVFSSTRAVQYGRHDKLQRAREIDSVPIKRASRFQLRHR